MVDLTSTFAYCDRPRIYKFSTLAGKKLSIQLFLKSTVLKLALLLIGSSELKSLFGLTSYFKALKKDYTP